MPDFEVTFIRDGREFQAIISGNDYKDAFENMKAMKETGVISGEIVERISAGLTNDQMDKIRMRRVRDEPTG